MHHISTVYLDEAVKFVVSGLQEKGINKSTEPFPRIFVKSVVNILAEPVGDKPQDQGCIFYLRNTQLLRQKMD